MFRKLLRSTACICISAAVTAGLGGCTGREAAADLTVRLGARAVELPAGGGAALAVDVAPREGVTLAVSLPAGSPLAAEVAPARGPGASAVITLRVARDAPPGAHDAVVVAHAGSRSAAAPLQVVVVEPGALASPRRAAPPRRSEPAVAGHARGAALD
jgi:hypothetical protein